MKVKRLAPKEPNEAEAAKLNKKQIGELINNYLVHNKPAACTINRHHDNFSELVFMPPNVPIEERDDEKNRAEINFRDQEQFAMAKGLITGWKMQDIRTNASIGSEVIVIVDKARFDEIKKRVEKDG